MVWEVYFFSEAGDGGVYWVEILLVASGRKLNSSWFKYNRGFIGSYK